MKAECSVVTSYRDEVCFLYKVLSLLKDGHGEACILLPDGVLENPQFTLLRKDLLEKCTITAIVSLPKFAFAPYTKEKMYAVFFTKRSPTITKVQKDPIWMYIIDNDGFANSDKRFPTKLRNNRNGWLHDEVSGWVSIEGEEEVGILEEAWLKLDDSATNGTEWIDEKGEKLKLRKGGFIDISKISKETQFCLMPEYYLRPFEPVFVTPEELVKGIEQIENATKALGQKPDAKTLPITAITYQAKDVPVSEVLNRHSGNSGLTEQEIYLRLLEGGQKYRVISAATMEEKELGYIPRIMLNGEMLKILEDEEGIAIVRKGKAGVTSFYEKGRYALTDDAYFLTPKSDSQYELDLRWLVTQYKQMFFDYSSSSDNGTWNMTNFYANAKIDIPSMPLQQTIVSYYKTLSDSNKNIEAVLSEINRLKSRQIVASYKNYQAKDYPISKVLNCHSGNSGLTAEIIYHWSYIKGDKYEVLSSATTEEKKLGFVPKFQLAGSGLVVFEGIEGILVSRNGNYAGTVTFLEKGRYTLTDHAYFLSLSPTCPYAVSLKWIVVQYRRLFLDYSSSNLAGNNATWNMTRFFKDVKIDIPSYEEQLELVRQYEKLESMQANLSSIKTKIDHYFARQFVAS